jgi:hypothetical protein
VKATSEGEIYPNLALWDNPSSPRDDESPSGCAGRFPDRVVDRDALSGGLFSSIVGRIDVIRGWTRIFLKAIPIDNNRM